MSQLRERYPEARAQEDLLNGSPTYSVWTAPPAGSGGRGTPEEEAEREWMRGGGL